MPNYTGNLSFSIVDAYSTRTSVNLPVNFADTVTLAQLHTAWDAAEALLQAIVGGSIERGRISFQQVVGAPSAAAADSRVEEVAVFNFAISGSSHRSGIAVPSFLDSKQTGGVINLADTDVAAFTALIPAAIPGSGTYTTPDGVNLGALVDAFLAFRKHRKQLRAHSFETA